MIFTRELMDQKETRQAAKKKFFYAYTALFKYNIQQLVNLTLLYQHIYLVNVLSSLKYCVLKSTWYI